MCLVTDLCIMYSVRKRYICVSKRNRAMTFDICYVQANFKSIISESIVFDLFQLQYVTHQPSLQCVCMAQQIVHVHYCKIGNMLYFQLFLCFFSYLFFFNYYYYYY